MPNWFRNTLIVTKGDPSRVFNATRTEGFLFDFNTLIPMPREIADAPVDPSTGVPEWYVWSIKNWGTKWNSCHAECSSTSPHNAICFDTAWSPPVPVFKALGLRFPDHEFTIHSDEWENHYHYTFLIQDGELAATTEICFCFDEEKDAVFTPEASQKLLTAFGAQQAVE